MKKIIILGSVFCEFLLGNLSLSADEMNWVPCKKTYISLDELFVRQQGIFVLLGNEWFQTSTVKHDAKGIFVSSLVQVDCWTCEYCGKSNGPWSIWCKNPVCENYGPD